MFVLHAVTFPFDSDSFAVMDEAVEDGGCNCGVIVKDAGPLFIGRVGGDDDGAAFITCADNPEKQV